MPRTGSRCMSSRCWSGRRAQVGPRQPGGIPIHAQRRGVEPAGCDSLHRAFVQGFRRRSEGRAHGVPRPTDRPRARRRGRSDGDDAARAQVLRRSPERLATRIRSRVFGGRPVAGDGRRARARSSRRSDPPRAHHRTPACASAGARWVRPGTAEVVSARAADDERRGSRRLRRYGARRPNTLTGCPRR